MGKRTEKAHAALTDALEAIEGMDDMTKWQRAQILLDVASVQASIARAEALEHANVIAVEVQEQQRDMQLLEYRERMRNVAV